VKHLIFFKHTDLLKTHRRAFIKCSHLLTVNC